MTKNYLVTNNGEFDFDFIDTMVDEVRTNIGWFKRYQEGDESVTWERAMVAVSHAVGCYNYLCAVWGLKPMPFMYLDTDCIENYLDDVESIIEEFWR